jgi:hypothetical protein
VIWRLLLLHRLFGYDYIQWRNSADQGVARVRLDGMGRAYYWRYESIKVIDYITDPKAVVWLTCSPDKYMDPSPMRRIAQEVAAERGLDCFNEGGGA